MNKTLYKPQQLPKQSPQKKTRGRNTNKNQRQATSTNNQLNPNSLQGKSGY